MLLADAGKCISSTSTVTISPDNRRLAFLVFISFSLVQPITDTPPLLSSFANQFCPVGVLHQLAKTAIHFTL
jgi:hypothetical protein